MTTLKQLVDEITDIKNELVTCHSKLKSNLTDKGIKVLSNDKMLNLINNVSNIVTPKTVRAGNSNILVSMIPSTGCEGIMICNGPGASGTITILSSPFSGSIRLALKTRMINEGYRGTVNIIKKNSLGHSETIATYLEETRKGLLRSYDISLNYGDSILLNCKIDSNGISLLHLAITYDL